jgi:hypothetical protein
MFEPIRGVLIEVDDYPFCKILLDKDYEWEPDNELELFIDNLQLDTQRIRDIKLKKILDGHDL